MTRRLPWLWAVAAFLAAASICAAAHAQDKAGTPSVEEIVNRANRVAYYQGEDGRADVTMAITDAQGRERTRRMTLLRRDAAPPADKTDEYGEDEYTGDQKFYVYFDAPPDVDGTVFMVWKHVAFDREDDRWLYLPDLDLVKRIAATDERTSFVGSHFFYEDVSGRSPNEDTHELVDVTDNYFVLDSKPQRPKRVEFARYRMWIHRTTYIPIKTEYYDKQGEKYREYTALAVDRIQGYWTVTKSRMKNLSTGGYTINEYTDVEYDVGLPEDIFTERYLRQPPRQYLGR